MNKKRVQIVIYALSLVLFSNNLGFATENKLAPQKEVKTKYPDYAKEFTGKDKFEGFNRKMFAFNSTLNKFIIKPINTVYASIMPKYGMERIKGVCKNIEYPVRVTSCLLQKDFKSSLNETIRFLTNSTIGLGGMYDPAKKLFKIKAKEEDMAQVLAHYKVKKGPYLVLPIVPPGNVRDLAGELLDIPLNPSSYIIGPIPAMVKAGLMVNRTTCLQSLISNLENTYADPYEITKKLYGLQQYIKNENIDRREVYAERVNANNLEAEEYNINETELTINSNLEEEPKCPCLPDIKLEKFNPQDPLTDSMRTAYFDAPNIKSSVWSEMSIWNRSFSKRIRSGYVRINEDLEKYKYKYIMQRDKNAPLAILYPSIGEGSNSHHSIVLGKLFYDAGYSVIMQGSTFHWKFAKSMPNGYIPGIPTRDANNVRMMTSKIIKKFEAKDYNFNNKIVVGTSFGALTTLFIGALEEKENILNVSNYISINPPVELLYALKQLDKNTLECMNNCPDLKNKTATTAQKVLSIVQNISETKEKPKNLPFTEDESKLVIGFIMKQKLSDLIFTIEKGSMTKKNAELYAMINDMTFYDYAKKYLQIENYETIEEFNQKTSLYSIASFLQNSNKYKIYHAIDDYFASPTQLAWLKNQCNERLALFDHGSHLGFLYRPEFLANFNSDIALKAPEQIEESTIQEVKKEQEIQEAKQIEKIQQATNEQEPQEVIPEQEAQEITPEKEKDLAAITTETITPELTTMKGD